MCPVQDFKKLRVWRSAHALALNVAESAREIRDTDYSSIRRQLIKTGFQITANIVEGREKSSEAEFVRHLEIAKGSVSELEQHIISAHDLELISGERFHALTDQVESVRKMLSRLIDKVRESIGEVEKKGRKQGTE